MRLRRDAKMELLRRAPLFSECSTRELQSVARLADEIDIEDGRTLIREGERGREFFALVEGTVAVSRKGRKLRELGAGDFFGEIALVTRVDRTSTVKATSPLRVLVVNGRDFERLLDEHPSIERKVLKALAERLAPETL